MSRKEAEALWAHYKYEVMWHSQKHYQQIRETLKTTDEKEIISEIIEEALAISPTKGSIINTIDHMWGYFKKIAGQDERETYIVLKEKFMKDEIISEELVHFIRALSEKYEMKYLQNSSIIKKTKISLLI